MQTLIQAFRGVLCPLCWSGSGLKLCHLIQVWTGKMFLTKIFYWST